MVLAAGCIGLVIEELFVMVHFNHYKTSRAARIITPNIWDIIVLTIVIGILATLAWGASQMITPYNIGEQIEISLSPRMLPEYALRTVLRMFIALFFSLLITLLIAPLAAKNSRVEKILVPCIDILQSIPVLGMLSITVVGFIQLFPNSLLGPECAAIFAVFTSQVWNMILSLYQSIRTVPQDLREVAKSYQLSSWQTFWHLEVPYGIPGLLWNTMVSMSAGWFFVVLSEAISVANQDITLPGLGSYISKAMIEANVTAIWYSIITMFIVILLYDQLLFRPLLAWVEKFHDEIDDERVAHESWFLDLLTKTRLLKLTKTIVSNILDIFINPPKLAYKISNFKFTGHKKFFKLAAKYASILFGLLVIVAISSSSWSTIQLIHNSMTLAEIIHVANLGLITAVKVIILVAIASLIWIPIGVWIGLSPKASKFIQPLIQFLAAFPVNFFYPIAVIFIIKYQLNKDVWTSPLMILGTQWYILFNVIAGTSRIPKELKFVAKNLRVSGWLWWKRLILPAIFPYYTTGAMAAAGGSWNASIVAEYVRWGDDTITAAGIGSYITEFTQTGDFPRIALGIGIMSLYVVLFNHLIWRKLYNLAEEHFTMS